MKTAFLKHTVLLLVAIAASITIKAQVSVSDNYSGRYNNYDEINTDTPGKVRETIHTFYDGNEYKIDLLNGTLCGLCVNGAKVPAEKYAQYEDVINKIEEQIKKDRIQAEADRKQADKDRAQANRDREQAGRDREQAQRDQVQANKDREQAERERGQAKTDQEQAVKDRAQANRDREQADRDREQAVKDRAQAQLDREQADRDREQAKEDRKLLDDMIADIIKDGIVPDEKSLFSITLNSTGMTVNDKQQPEAVFTHYKEKYNRWALCNFSYGDDHHGFNGVHMSRK